jgi:hypothetical protein
VKWFWISLGRYFDKSNGISRKKSTRLHFTKADKPLEQMSPEERQDFAKRIVDGFLNEENKRNE